MHELLESIRAAVADRATAEQKAAGAHACRTLLAALETEAGKPLGPPGAPSAPVQAGAAPGQVLDLLIGRLRAALPEGAGDQRAAGQPPDRSRSGLRIALVSPPAGVPWRSGRGSGRSKP